MQSAAAVLDFGARPEAVGLVVESERLAFGHQANPAYAIETSRIDPLPHQRIAVYERMLPQSRLRFLLADDAGAGKTIMAGLYIREMLSRRLIRRILVVPPAGLVGNWESELSKLFRLEFRIVAGSDAKDANPFVGEASDQLIVSLDTLRGERMFARLQEPDVEPYDLVIFDEAHKLSARREQDFRIDKTERYKLAEALAGAPVDEERWRLQWSARHLLLLTATPHMGYEFPYYSLWRLLEPQVLSTELAFKEYSAAARRRHFIRRAKEEMRYLDGKPIYPPRSSQTFSYVLTPDERELYGETTDYIEKYYNQAKVLNRAAARMVMSIYQRRLASSAWALWRSFCRREERLRALIAQVARGEVSEEHLKNLQQQLKLEDLYEEQTADDDQAEGEREGIEVQEDEALQLVLGGSLAELEGELEHVQRIKDLAYKVYDARNESKLNKLRELIDSDSYRHEKVLIFTEQKDTMDFLVERLSELGAVDQIAQIHGGMDHRKRAAQVDFFRKPIAEGGARFLVATDAAGEGINLQFCWFMVNYDIPWNPARLEQRLGRIHRYGQQRDVYIANLMAADTREGKVMGRLLEKLEEIRKELSSDKVFDVIGHLFREKSIRHYIDAALAGDLDAVILELEGELTAEQIQAIEVREQKWLGEGDDISRELERLKEELRHEAQQHVLPGFVRSFIERTCALLGIRIEEQGDGYFALRPERPGALDALRPVLEGYPEEAWDRLTVERPHKDEQAIFLHPGEPVYDKLRYMLLAEYQDEARRGAVYIDPTASEPCFLHFASATVVRRPDETYPALARQETLEHRLVAIRQDQSGALSEDPAGQLLLLRPAPALNGHYLPAAHIQYVAVAKQSIAEAAAYAATQIAGQLAQVRIDALTASLPERIAQLSSGFQHEEVELAALRQKLKKRADADVPHARAELSKVKERQQTLNHRKQQALAALSREPELVEPGPVDFIAHILVIPSSDPEDQERYDQQTEAIAMQHAIAYEKQQGAEVIDVTTEPKWRQAGYREPPGFDLLSRRPDETELSIEVKGRGHSGSVELTFNEWFRARNLRQLYWLYTVFNCVSDSPRLERVQDPYTRGIGTPTGSVIIKASEIHAHAEQE